LIKNEEDSAADLCNRSES